MTHPEAIRQVLVDDHEQYVKGEMPNDRLGSLLGDGLFLAEGDAWQRQRRAMQPAFFREQIEGYGESVVDHTRAVTDGWDDGETVAIDEVASTLTLRVLASTLLGIDAEAERETVRRAATAITQRYDTARLGSYLPEWLPTPTNRRYRRSLSDLHDLVDREVAARRSAGGQPGDLLSMLVAASDEGAIDDDTLRGNVVTFLFAGHETTALGLTYTLYLLATQPATQRRLRDRLDATLDGEPTPADLRNLPLLAAVIDESLRLYPPVYTFFREPTADVTLRGYRVPEGSVISLPQCVVHRDERWWDDPDSFNPDRWLGETDRPEYAYFPFGGGPRHCIGMRFARLELRLAVAVLLASFRFEAVTESLSRTASANAKPTEPVVLRVRKR
ncbi:cytochrome P450 119 [Halolamina pelagica]|uniref:Cytochrome P450 119 n=1 Tax=Halolamina pelagica TaxID=699431 RepID=A0A0P7FSN5_9EURY|nr:cytochrome P450 [Halolamina pelagica]KPN29685.1 cytochrome P450 119 [Halolamina pelagica]